MVAETGGGRLETALATLMSIEKVSPIPMVFDNKLIAAMRLYTGGEFGVTRLFPTGRKSQ